jgi:cyclopropane-fatty-acyl-phospholipid synthase
MTAVKKKNKPPYSLRLIIMALNQIKVGHIDLQLPDGREYSFGDKNSTDHATIKILDETLFRRILFSGSLGFAESYMAEEWSCDDLAKLLTILSQNQAYFKQIIDRSSFMSFINRLIHIMRPNSKRGSRKNIYSHYDLGNDFYSQWLDPSMSYSSARFDSGVNDLETAQWEKYKVLAEAIDLKPEHRVLEIGCGWGGFAEYAAQNIGCEIVGITISQEQLNFARDRIKNKSLKADLRFQDYRDIDETFDRIVSIEMFEAVGEKYWPTYFKKIHDCLTPDGKAGLQIITIDDNNFASYQRRVDFIQKYIFPGGMLPSPSRLTELFNQLGFAEKSNLSFGHDYAKTLAIWREQFSKAWPKITRQGFDERFKNMWNYYLAYCEAGFATKSIDVKQITIEKASA